MRLSAEQIDSIFEDSERLLRDEPQIHDPRTHRWQRHLMFAHAVLGEDWLTAFQIAAAFGHEPLPLDAMHRIAIGWSDDLREVAR
jgi:hypothetical protein